MILQKSAIAPYKFLERKHDVKVDFLDPFDLEPIDKSNFYRYKIELLENSSILFTAKALIDAFFQLIIDTEFKFLQTPIFYCTTSLLMDYLQKYITITEKKRSEFIVGNKPEELVQKFARKKENILFLCTDKGGGKIAHFLKKKRCKIREVVILNKKNKKLNNHFEWKDYDIIAFFNDQILKSFTESFPDFSTKSTKKCSLAVFGKVTDKMAKKYKWKVVVKAPSPEFTSLAMALDAYLTTIKTH